ncbi:MAG: prephenate/arogenate dehydrogenase [Leptolyngbyaceae cyanobacterium MO_188.B28]|nr:prephenate/arogenate dehydrogenase [Leptolyngbyaceae cyanobacterium MO_188.B28]
MNVGIIGLGLIGGSLGLDLRRLGHRVLGCSRRGPICQAAIERGVVDEASLDLMLMAKADVVFVCTPIAAIEPTVARLAPLLSDQTIVTDVGSVKGDLVSAAARHWPNFVGGHPMAGKAEAGLEAAEAGLFERCAYVLTPLEATPKTALETVAEIARSLQAQVYQCSPSAHDRAVAWISHLPVMVSSSLIQACLNESDATILELAKNLASSGFRDTSRVGGGNPELGMMMAQYNREAVLYALQKYRRTLDQVIYQIEHHDWEQLNQQLQQTQQARPEFMLSPPVPDKAKR